jgi:fibronectin-binding autotransporter adhesin
LISAKGMQTIGNVAHPISGSITVQGGGSATTTGAYAGITALSSQNIDVTGNLTVNGSQTSTTTHNDDYGSVTTAADQTIVVGGGMTVSAMEGSSAGAGGVGPLGGSPAGTGAVVAATGGVQSITVNGAAGLQVLGGNGTANATGAAIAETGAFDQNITVAIGTVQVTGGSDKGGFAQISSGATQEIMINDTANNGNSLVVQDGSGTAVGAPLIASNATISAVGVQTITATTGNVLVSATNGNQAVISSNVTQTVTLDGNLGHGGYLNMTGTNGGLANITSGTLAVGGTTTLNIDGVVNGVTGISTWAGNSVIGTNLETNDVVINNAAPIIISGATPTAQGGYSANVFANFNPTSLIEFQGAGSVGITIPATQVTPAVPRLRERQQERVCERSADGRGPRRNGQ